jgi:hypothetical protein
MMVHFPTDWCSNSTSERDAIAMTHTVMTFVTRVRLDRTTELRTLLNKIGDVPENNDCIPFRKLTLLHFASLVLHDSQKEYGYGPYLVFENNFDGPLEPYLEDLYRIASLGLHQIYSCCDGYAITRADDRQGILDYLRAHVVRPNAYHIGNTGRTAERILQEQKLRDALETCADRLVKDGKPHSPDDLRGSLQKFARSTPDFANMPAVGPRQTFLEKFLPWVKIVLVGLVAVLLAWLRFPWGLICMLVLVGIYAVALRLKESTDPVKSDAPNPDNLKKLVEKEDRTHSVQNHMASITIVKPGWLRRATLWTVLWAVNLLARARATHGELSGIPSIHFAHWSLIDGGRRLLFLSNFDGSWENYLDDFIDKAHAGLTAVWSNTVGFPRTQFVVFGGATDGPRFKAVARDSQTVTNAWYSAYRDLTVQGIDNNSSIREQLFRPLNERAAAAWLQRF